MGLIYMDMGTKMSRRLDGSLKSEHYVDFYTQPLWEHIKFVAYQWYDERVIKVPGARWLDRTLYRLRGRNDPMGLPWFVSQDLKCFALGHHKRHDLAQVLIANLDYERLASVRYPGFSVRQDNEPTLRAVPAPVTTREE